MTRIMTVVGARPQFIKAATVSRVISARDDISEILVHTGQHYDDNMSEIFFREMAIPKPQVNLEIGSDSHGRQTGRMLAGIEALLEEHAPDWLVVYGDTNSTLAGALAAAKLHVPVAHVEAGLRSFNRRMPEEVNRVLTDHVADLLCVPSRVALDNLAREGIADGRVRITGDVMYDALLFYRESCPDTEMTSARHALPEPGFILATIHRAENTDDPARMQVIVASLERAAESRPVVIPMHPRTRGMMARTGLAFASPQVTVIEPVGYLDMLTLQARSGLIVTDSGGMQKEAFFNGVPCVTVRDETEWVELVELGWNTLAPPDSVDALAEAIVSSLDRRGRDGQPYGDGHAAEKIVSALAEG